MKISLIALISSAAAISEQTGASLMLPWVILTEANSAYFNTVLNTLNAQTPPNINAGSASLADNEWKISMQESAFFIEPITNEPTTIIFGSSNVHIGFHSTTLSYDLGPILGHIHGSLDAVISNMQIVAEVDISTCVFPSTYENRYLPNPHVVNTQVSIPGDGLQVSLYGDPLLTVVTALLPLFEGVIRQQIITQVEQELQGQVSQVMAQIVAGPILNHGHIPIYNQMDYDFSLSHDVTATEAGGIEWQTRGTFFPESTQESVRPSVVPPAMPIKDSNVDGSLVQGWVSDYTIDSLASSFVKTSPYDFWIQPASVPASSPFKLDTTDLSIFFPGISTKYGIGLPMSMKININKMGGFQSTEAGVLQMTTTLDMTFYVHKADGTDELACEIQLQDTNFGFSAIIDSMVLHPKILSADISTIVQVSSTFGAIDTAQMAALFQQILTISLDPINSAINSFTLTIPDKVFGLFGLSQLQLIYHTNYVEVLLKPQFIAPTSWMPATTEI